MKRKMLTTNSDNFIFKVFIALSVGLFVMFNCIIELRTNVVGIKSYSITILIKTTPTFRYKETEGPLLVVSSTTKVLKPSLSLILAHFSTQTMVDKLFN